MRVFYTYCILENFESDKCKDTFLYEITRKKYGMKFCNIYRKHFSAFTNFMII